MPKRSLSEFPHIFLSTRERSAEIYRARQRGEVIKIGPRLYTTLVRQNPRHLIQQRRWPIVGLYAPGAVIGYRTGLDSKPTEDGTVFLSGPKRQMIDLDGLRIRVLPGAGPLEGDTEFIGGLYLPSKARAILESLKQSRARPGAAQTTVHGVPQSEIETYLDRLLNTSGEEAVNALRDLGRRIAPTLDAPKEMEKLDRIVGALLGTRDGVVAAPYLTARRADPPYDADRLVLFEQLHTVLSQPMPRRPDPAPAGEAFRNAAFLDAYFSNYIEGTELEIGEAREIIFHGRLAEQRPADSHDVIGTFEVVGSADFMHVSVRELSDAEAFIARLEWSHRRIMAGRPEHTPGIFKEKANRAGRSQFVHPELVRGTMTQGFVVARSLHDAFSRAAALMFLVSEVHPFADGNGRVARAIMNAELVSGGLSRIIIPTVYREDYLGGLRVLTRRGDPEPFVKVLDYAQAVTSWVDYTDLDRAIAMFEACHAFDDESDGTRLRLPASFASK